MLSQNQFAQSPIQGMTDMKFNGSSVSVQIDVSSVQVGGLLAGQPVKVVDSAGGVPKVVECDADSDDIFGFINYDLKSPSFLPGAMAEVSCFNGNCMFMTAAAPISRNAKVSILLAGQQVIPAAAGKTIIGRAFDKAVNIGDIIRVFIQLPGATD